MQEAVTTGGFKNQ